MNAPANITARKTTGEDIYRIVYKAVDADLAAQESGGRKFNRREAVRKKLLEALLCDPRDDDHAALFRALVAGHHYYDKDAWVTEDDAHFLREAIGELEVASAQMLDRWTDHADWMEAPA